MNTESNFGGIENLEERLMLAGNVTGEVIDGTLRLQGDVRDNWLQILQTTDSIFRVVGLDSPTPPEGDPSDAPTRINGAGQFFFSNVTDITFNGKRGDDFVFLNGDTGQGATREVDLPGDLRLRGSFGTDNILIENSTIRGNTHLSGNTGGDTIQTIDSTHVKRFDVFGGDQGDTIGAFRSVFRELANFNSGKGPDRIFIGLEQGSLEGSNFRKNLNIRSSDPKFIGNQNFIELTKTTVIGNTKIVGGGQKDDVDINDSVFIRKFELFTTGGLDLIEINDSRFLGRGNASKIVSGGERDVIRVFDSLFEGDDILFSGGAGNDLLEIQDSDFTGDADDRLFHGGGGDLDRIDAGLPGLDPDTNTNDNLFENGSGQFIQWER